MHSAITPELVYELVSVASPSVSPDGKRLAFVRSHVDRDSAETQIADHDDGHSIE